VIRADAGWAGTGDRIRRFVVGVGRIPGSTEDVHCPGPRDSQDLSRGVDVPGQFPALCYLRRALRIWPPRQDPAQAGTKGLAGLAQDAGISDREKEIIGLVALGLDNREIGKRLFHIAQDSQEPHDQHLCEDGRPEPGSIGHLLNRPEDGRGPGPAAARPDPGKR